MKIAFYKGLHRDTTLVDIGVCLATLSPYSHCEILFSDGISASSSLRDGGVRFTKINFDSGRWDVFDLNLPVSQETAARAMFNLYEEHPYDLLGATAAWLRLNYKASPPAFFCSKICAIACGLADTSRSPGNLFAALGVRGVLGSKTILWN